MQHKKKAYTTAIMAFLTLSLILSSILATVAAAGAITLTPAAQAPGESVTVDGTSFGVTKAVGLGLGAEVNATDEATPAPTGTGTGPWTSRVAHYPIKPGSFRLHSDVSGVGSDYTDNGDGTLASTSTYFVSGTINYVTGVFSRISTSDLSSYTIVQTASYTYYQYNVTPAAGVTTDGSGAFSASITVPVVADENYTVTAVDTQGNLAVATLSVDVTIIPESLNLGLVLLLSTVMVVVSFRYFRKRQKIENYSQAKL